MEDVLIENKSFFSKAGDFFASLLTKNKKRDVKTSRFNHYLSYLNKNDKAYDDLSIAVDICDEAYSIVERRIMLTERLKNIKREMAEINSYKTLTDEDLKYLKELLARYTSISKDRNALRSQINEFDRSLAFMAGFEEEAPKAIKEIKEAEEKQRIYKSDLSILEGERADLVYQRENLSAGLVFIQKFSMGLCVFFGIAMMVLIYLLVIPKINITTPMFVIIILMFLGAVLLYIFRRRIIFEMELNLKKQSRAVEYINKKSVVYAHYTNFLNFEYKKFKVRNSKMLADNLADYGLYKHLTSRQDVMRNIMYQTEAELEKFMRSHKISTGALTIDKLSREIDIDKQLNKYRELEVEKTATDQSLTQIEKRQSDIWDTLVNLSEVDKTEEKLITKLIQSYMDATNSLMDKVKDFNIVELSDLDDELSI